MKIQPTTRPPHTLFVPDLPPITAQNKPCVSTGALLATQTFDSHRASYKAFFGQGPSIRDAAEDYLRVALQQVQSTADDLPDSPESLLAWMRASAERAKCEYQSYLRQRKAGAMRRLFFNRSHALHFLQSVAPTKLVDGAWLYGMLRQARDPRLSGLARTYLEELGNGDDSKNHVLLYRQLLASHDLSCEPELPDAYYQQGAIQLALGHCADSMLPEVIGFNLGYEQLPLHLMISAYELNELGLDPYYFTLHLTVDNCASGHARKAVDAVSDNAGRYPDDAAYWRRVRHGYRLNELGVGTNSAIAQFDIEREIGRIFASKAEAGAGAHSDYCRIEGKTVNEWLSNSQDVPAFLHALEKKGWIVRGPTPQASRFWRLLQGPRAEMFGVFTDYELQLIFDWMRGEASADGLTFDAGSSAPVRTRTFRARRTLCDAKKSCESKPLQFVLPREQADLERLSPESHWTPEGLKATRQFIAQWIAGGEAH